jgi:hypothetical protein
VSSSNSSQGNSEQVGVERGSLMVVDGVGADGGAEVAGRVIETILALLEAGPSTGL